MLSVGYAVLTEKPQLKQGTTKNYSLLKVKFLDRYKQENNYKDKYFHCTVLFWDILDPLIDVNTVIYLEGYFKKNQNKDSKSIYYSFIANKLYDSKLIFDEKKFDHDNYDSYKSDVKEDDENNQFNIGF